MLRGSMLRSPQRVYSGEALEAWFERLAEPWESAFPPDVLEVGRRWYRDGEVRGLELSPQSAIVHAKRDRQDLYAVVEWHDREPVVRASSRDRLEAHALAVAGLYEIEELITDELPPLPDGPRVEAPEPEPRLLARRTREEEAPKRPLVVRLETEAQGLRLTAFWKNGQAHAESAFRAQVLPRGEREDLIRLTTQARQAHFTHRVEQGDYVLTDLRRAAAFVRLELPRWRRAFVVEVDPKVERLARAPRVLQLAFEAEEHAAATFRYRWRLRAGDTWLDDAAVAKVLRSPDGPHLLDGHGIVELSPGAREQLAEVGEALRQPQGEAARYLLFTLPTDDSGARLSEMLQTWKAALGAEPAEDLATPDFLRPYQRDGVRWLHHVLTFSGQPLLADEMGLGKTLQVLALLTSRWQDDRPSLVVCPASVVPVWMSEAERYFPSLPVRRLLASDHPGTHPGKTLWVGSYAQLRRLRDDLPAWSFAYAVLDEAQFIKNPMARVSQVCGEIRAEHRLALTGTPIENHQLDLWSVFRFLMPGLLGSRMHLEARLQADPGEANRRLRRQIAPFFLRRTKDEVLAQLPPKMEFVQACPLTRLQQEEYRRWTELLWRQFGNDLGRLRREQTISFLSGLTRLRQICCDPGLLPWLSVPPEESGKIGSLLVRLSDIFDNGAKAVVFSQFVRFLDRAKGAVRRRFPHVGIWELTGRSGDRQAPVRGFQESREPGVIFVSLRAGGTGVTLNTAQYVFLLDPWWNPAVEAQAIDRVHRFGQERAVTTYRLITAGTIEERIESLKDRKRETFQQVFAGLGGSTSLARHFQSLEELIALRDDGLIEGESGREDE